MNKWGRNSARIAAALILAGTFAGAAMADELTPQPGNLTGFGRPGSVLIFPYVNSGIGKTLVTITNTNGDHNYCGGGVPDIYGGTVRVKLFFVFEEEGPAGTVCSLQDRIITLTPNDTYSFFADDEFDEDFEGWVIAAALSALDVEGETRLIDFDYLVGSAQVYQTDQDYVWAYDAYAFRSQSWRIPIPDYDDCGHVLASPDDTIDFDAMEYDAFPLLTVIPQVFQQGTGGGTHDDFSNFLALMSTELENPYEVKTLIFNNSEERFSRNFDITCFKAGNLVDDFDIFVDFYLQGTLDPTDDPDELKYSGWMLFYQTPPSDADGTHGMLAVFAQSANAVWWSGANAWTGPIFVERFLPNHAAFYMGLNGSD